MPHLTETSPWAEASLVIPTDTVKRFINDNPTVDSKLVDLGQVGVGTYGSGSVAAAGDIFIHYTVSFFEPQPSAGLITTFRVINDNLETPGVGLIRVGKTTTTFAVAFNSPGTFLVYINLKASTFATDTLTSGVVENSHFSAFSTSNITVVYNITIATLGSGIALTGTDFGNHSIQVVRAKVANSVTFP
jgi:hypothetical protein